MLYDYKCPQCGKQTEAINKIADRHTNAPECHGKMQLFISRAPYAYMPMEIRYVCPVTRTGITNKRQRLNVMAKYDLVDANDIVTDKSIDRQLKRKEELDNIVASNRPPEELTKQVNKWAESSL